VTIPISRTIHDHSPLSAAKNPNPTAGDGEFDLRPGDLLVGRSVTINRPREELYAFWRDFSNLPRFMQNVHAVTFQDGTHSHWVIEAPAGKTVEWDSEITHDEPGTLIAWRSLEGASVRNSGQVEFLDSPDDRGTVVRVKLAYDPPAGTIGQLIAKIFQKEPKVQARQRPWSLDAISGAEKSCWPCATFERTWARKSTLNSNLTASASGCN
jgi:uncharacterized membrane protein